MDNAILNLIQTTLHRPPDPVGLLTLHAVLPADRFSLKQWNNALTLLTGRRAYCRSYQEVGRAIQRLL